MRQFDVLLDATSLTRDEQGIISTRTYQIIRRVKAKHEHQAITIAELLESSDNRDCKIVSLARWAIVVGENEQTITA